MTEAKRETRDPDIPPSPPANPATSQLLTVEERRSLHLDDPDEYMKRIYFWQDVPRRAKYNEIWNEVKSAQGVPPPSRRSMRLRLPRFWKSAAWRKVSAPPKSSRISRCESPLANFLLSSARAARARPRFSASLPASNSPPPPQSGRATSASIASSPTSA